MRSISRTPLAAFWAACLAASLCASPAGAEFSLIGEVLDRLQHDYVDAAAQVPSRLLGAALEAASDAYPAVVVLRESAPIVEGEDSWRVEAGGEVMRVGPREADSWPALAGALGRLRAFLRAALWHKASEEAIEITLIQGLLRELDPHSEFFTPRAYKEFLGSTSGNIGGIGLVVSQRDGSLRVEEVLPGTPGSRAGIRAGESIVEIGPRFAEGMPMDEAVQLMRGEPGQPVELGVLAPGQRTPRRVSVVRAAIHFPSVEGELLGEDASGTIGYLHLRAFQPDSPEALRRLAERWMRLEPPPLGLILDLRGNPGGGLNEAIAVADLFLSGGTIVKTMRPGRQTEVAAASAAPDDLLLPVAVLIDERSASAAEIVAAALKNHGRTALIGERSVGKATVQTVFFLPGGNALKLTIAQYLTPGDRSIQGIGVTPHVVLRPVRVAPGEFRLRPEEPGRTARPGRPLTVPLLPEPPLAVLPVLSEPAQPLAGRDRGEAVDDTLALARRVLVAHRRRDPRGLVDTLVSVAREEALKNQAEIAARLLAMDIDWRASGAESPPELVLERIQAEAGGDGQAWRPAGGGIAPGEWLRLTLSVRNKGPRPAARVLAVLRSGSGAFADLELPIGWLEPGARAERVGEWPLAGRPIPPLEPLELILLAQGGRELRRERIWLPVRDEPEPRYSAELTLREEGDGDGRLERGEVLALRLRLSNAGGAPTGAGRLLADWPARHAAVLEGFPIDVPPIGRNGTWEAHARLRLEDDPETGPWPLILRARALEADAGQLEMRLAVAPELPEAPIPFVPPAIELTGAAAPGAEGTVNLSGLLRDDRGARDVTIRVNGHKAFHQAARGISVLTLAFQTELPLERGWNRIHVEARDEEGLVSRRQFGVWKGEETGPLLDGAER
jgi:carboxyl-terminal processing protease